MALMEHLVELGHRRIAHIGGDQISEASRERSGAFLQSVEFFKLNPLDCPVHFSDWQSAEARILARGLLKPLTRPTAVVCANDLIAACTLQVANELNLKVPEELSIVGMTNERVSRLTVPEITTISIPEEEIGRAAMLALIKSIDTKQADRTKEIDRHACSIMIRGTSATAPE
jgi:LacI family transcriptional regulator